MLTTTGIRLFTTIYLLSIDIELNVFDIVVEVNKEVSQLHTVLHKKYIPKYCVIVLKQKCQF